jgi:hypothetical protein
MRNLPVRITQGHMIAFDATLREAVTVVSRLSLPSSLRDSAILFLPLADRVRGVGQHRGSLDLPRSAVGLPGPQQAKYRTWLSRALFARSFSTGSTPSTYCGVAASQPPLSRSRTAVPMPMDGTFCPRRPPFSPLTTWAWTASTCLVCRRLCRQPSRVNARGLFCSLAVKMWPFTSAAAPSLAPWTGSMTCNQL